MTVRELLAQLQALGDEYLDAPVSLAGDEYRLETLKAGRDWNGPWVDLTESYRERPCADDPDASYRLVSAADPAVVKQWAASLWKNLPDEILIGKSLK